MNCGNCGDRVIREELIDSLNIPVDVADEYELFVGQYVEFCFNCSPNWDRYALLVRTATHQHQPPVNPWPLFFSTTTGQLREDFIPRPQVQRERRIPRRRRIVRNPDECGCNFCSGER